MFFDIRYIALVVLSHVARSVMAGKKSCRQCSGLLELKFDSYASEALARDATRRFISACATGNQFEITGVNTEGLCGGLDTIICKHWVIKLTIWRYCGNGGTVLKAKQGTPKVLTCDGNVACTANSVLTMSCHKSVECAGDCILSQC